MADDRLCRTPEHPVMNENQAGSRLDRAADRGAREINRCDDSRDVTAIFQLHAVQRTWIVRNARDLQQFVEECGDLGELCHFFAADVSTWTL